MRINPKEAADQSHGEHGELVAKMAVNHKSRWGEFMRFISPKFQTFSFDLLSTHRTTLVAAGLKELPTSLWNCRQLRQLDVGGNPLSRGQNLSS